MLHNSVIDQLFGCFTIQLLTNYLDASQFSYCPFIWMLHNSVIAIYLDASQFSYCPFIWMLHNSVIDQLFGCFTIQLLPIYLDASQFSYCPFIWMLHSRTLNNRINRTHERVHDQDKKSSFNCFNELQKDIL